MIKKITIASLASLVLFSQAANSEIKVGPLTVSPGIMFQTNYVGEFTGLTTNRTQPTYGVDVNIAHDTGAYIYSALKKFKNFPDAASVAYGTFDSEFCNSLGFANKIQSLNYDFSYENCYVDTITAENTGTFYFRLSGEVAKGTALGAAYAKDSTDGNAAAAGTNPQFGQDAYKIFASKELPLAKATVTYGESKNLTEFYTVGLNKDVFGINFDLTYWNVDTDNWAKTTNLNYHNRELLVLSAKKTF